MLFSIRNFHIHNLCGECMKQHANPWIRIFAYAIPYPEASVLRLIPKACRLFCRRKSEPRFFAVYTILPGRCQTPYKYIHMKKLELRYMVQNDTWDTLLTWFNLIQHWKMITRPDKCGLKLLIRSQISTVASWEFGSNFILHFLMDVITYLCCD